MLSSNRERKQIQSTNLTFRSLKTGNFDLPIAEKLVGCAHSRVYEEDQLKHFDQNQELKLLNEIDILKFLQMKKKKDLI